MLLEVLELVSLRLSSSLSACKFLEYLGTCRLRKRREYVRATREPLLKLLLFLWTLLYQSPFDSTVPYAYVDLSNLLGATIDQHTYLPFVQKSYFIICACPEQEVKHAAGMFESSGWALMT